jgi:hypothetical protein
MKDREKEGRKERKKERESRTKDVVKGFTQLIKGWKKSRNSGKKKDKKFRAEKE